ncbi:hypothetical protein HMPREF3201_01339 [Megasphaera sp. MJR8396C]|nr:hypothetical protein HMPREF3201_01339 [Megasphaera sp. MJR8396C]
MYYEKPAYRHDFIIHTIFQLIIGIFHDRIKSNYIYGTKGTAAPKGSGLFQKQNHL